MMRKSYVAFLIGMLALICAPLLTAATPPVLNVSTSGGQLASIDFTGAVAFSGSCTPATCMTSAGYPQVMPGQINWSGKMGTFTVVASIGITKPLASPNPSQDLDLQHISTTADGTITFQWTDSNFNYTGITGGSLVAGGS